MPPRMPKAALHMSTPQCAQVGATIREKVIPHAVHWYTGEAIDDEPFADMFGGDE